MHVHVHRADEAKYWLEPIIGLARNYGLSPQQMTKIKGIVQEPEDELINAWIFHFGN